MGINVVRLNQQTGVTLQPVALTAAERLNSESAFSCCALCLFSSSTTGNRFSMLKQAWSLRNTPQTRSYGTANPTTTFKIGSGLKLSALYPPTGDFASLRNAVYSQYKQRSAGGIWRLVHYLKVYIHICLFIRLHKMLWKIWDLFLA